MTSLINARATRGSDDELIVEDLLEEWPTGPPDLPPIEAWVTSNPSYRNLLISEDARFTTVVIRPSAYSSGGSGDAGVDLAAAFDDDGEAGADDEEPVYLSDEEVAEVVASVRTIVADFDAPDFAIAMAGPPVAMDVVKQNMRSDMMGFIRLTVLVIAVLLFVLFRRASAVFLPLVPVALNAALVRRITIGMKARTGARVDGTWNPSILLEIRATRALILPLTRSATRC